MDDMKILYKEKLKIYKKRRQYIEDEFVEISHIMKKISEEKVKEEINNMLSKNYKEMIDLEIAIAALEEATK